MSVFSHGPSHQRRQSGSAGGAFIAENLGFNRQTQTQIQQQQQQQQQQRGGGGTAMSYTNTGGNNNNNMDSLSYPTSTTSSASSTPSSSSQTNSARSSIMSTQLTHAHAMLKDMKRRSSAGGPSGGRANSHSPYPHPHPSLAPNNPSSLPLTPSTTSPHSAMSSSSATNTSTASGGGVGGGGGSHLKLKRKLRKNTREKQRRSELNDKFDLLQELLQLGGGGQTKVEKFTVLSEAIAVIELLRKENYELKSERNELRNEVKQMTKVLENAFPAQPELVKDFAQKFFPTSTAAAPVVTSNHHVLNTPLSQQSSVYNFSSLPMQGFSGINSAASTPSAAASFAANALQSPTQPNYLFYPQPQQQQIQQQQQLLQQQQQHQLLAGGVAYNTQPPLSSALSINKAATHRRGHSRSGSSSSFQSMPGLGMMTPPASASSSFPTTLSAAQHQRKPSASSFITAQHFPASGNVRANSIKNETGMTFLGQQQPQQQQAQTNMSISPTAISSSFTHVPNSFPSFSSVFHSSLSTSSTSTTDTNHSSSSSSIMSNASTVGANNPQSAPVPHHHHIKQPSSEFKFSLTSLNSVSPSPSPTSLLMRQQGQHHVQHQRSLSGANYNINFNLGMTPIDGINEQQQNHSHSHSHQLINPLDSPSAAMFTLQQQQQQQQQQQAQAANSAHHHHVSSVGSTSAMLSLLNDQTSNNNIPGGKNSTTTTSQEMFGMDDIINADYN